MSMERLAYTEMLRVLAGPIARCGRWLRALLPIALPLRALRSRPGRTTHEALIVALALLPAALGVAINLAALRAAQLIGRWPIPIRDDPKFYIPDDALFETLYSWCYQIEQWHSLTVLPLIGLVILYAFTGAPGRARRATWLCLLSLAAMFFFSHFGWYID